MKKGKPQRLSFDEFKSRFDIQLNEQQERAVRKADGPALLLAVPGSGKTTVIATRVAYLIFCEGVPPERVLTLTFSRAAAAEMRERFSLKFGAEVAEQTHFSTIHSFCYSVIRRYAGEYGYPVPELVTDNNKIIRKLCISEFYHAPDDNAVKRLAQYLSYCKNRMIGLVEIESFQFADLDFRRFFEAYEAYMRRNDLMDFDDQLLLANRLIDYYPDLLTRLHERYHYINVDEAQDNSYLQHVIIRKLSSGHDRLFMVGDEDQSIYGFRAAYPDALMNFRQEHPNAEIMYMETNYRCCKAIANTALRIIGDNRNRYDKQMNTVHEQGAVVRKKLRDSRKQYRYLLRELRRSVKKGSKVAVLCRNHTSGIPLFDLLDREGVPFSGELDADFFDDRLVLDIVCALRLAANPRDIDAYSQIYWKLGLDTTKPQYMRVVSDIRRGIRGTIFERLAALCRGSAADRIIEFGDEMDVIGEMAPYYAIENINRLFYMRWIRQQEKRGVESFAGMEERLLTLLALAAEQKSIEGFLARLRQLRALRKMDNGRSVTLATIHQSKGKEFDKVFIIDLYRGILPSDNTTGIAEIYQSDKYEEETRLLYVAITRARHEIEVVTAPKRFGREHELSPFVNILFPKKDRKRKWDKRAGPLSYLGPHDSPHVGKEPIPPSPNPHLTTRVAGTGGRASCFTAKPATRVAGARNQSQYPTAPCPALSGFKPGSWVIHKYFGRGIIINRTGDILAIRFAEGDKRMLLSACLKWGYLSLAHPD